MDQAAWVLDDDLVRLGMESLPIPEQDTVLVGLWAANSTHWDAI